MFQLARQPFDLLPARLRTDLGRRVTGLIVALALEALLILALLTLSQSGEQPEEPRSALSTFDATTASQEEPATPEPTPAEPQPAVREANLPEQAEPAPAEPAPARPALIPVPREQMPSFDISRIKTPQASKPAANRPMMGPVNTNSQPDTPRVGTAPNGQPLYAAQWYREPYDSELAGYLSTAQGPGWGLIACRTAPEYRVEDCVALDEHPSNSQIARSVLAAAWQFKVRPPRLGGRYMVGEWVRIRIDYGIRREARP